MEIRPRISTDLTAHGGLLKRNCWFGRRGPQRAALQSFGSCDAMWRPLVECLWDVRREFAELDAGRLAIMWLGRAGRARGQSGRASQSCGVCVGGGGNNQWMPLGCSLRAGAWSSKEDLDGATGRLPFVKQQ